MRAGSEARRAGTFAGWFALFTVGWALLVISIGGLVTSKGVGMAVPDWPTTYGYNMFFFPIRLWNGGIFHEHLHRLVASVLGLFTVVLALWIQQTDGRAWLRRVAWVAVGMVVIQGVLGGKRVQLNAVNVGSIPGSVFFGVLHAVLAQLFLGTLAVIAVATSPIRQRFWDGVRSRRVGRWVIALLVGIVIQLGVAATMRHQHAGLAIPDFPLAYGRVYPSTDAGFLAAVNQRRVGVVDDAPVTAFQIHLQMVHRAIAVLLVGGVIGLVREMRQESRSWRRAVGLWAMLFAVQFALGAATIWTNKAADIATVHVAVGALIAAWGFALAGLRVRAEQQYLEAFASCSGTDALLKSSAGSSVA